ncbi:hypothetical protein BC567DRAFT_235791 [Phyllosticta citribraziliensis]
MPIYASACHPSQRAANGIKQPPLTHLRAWGKRPEAGTYIPTRLPTSPVPSKDTRGRWRGREKWRIGCRQIPTTATTSRRRRRRRRKGGNGGNARRRYARKARRWKRARKRASERDRRRGAGRVGSGPPSAVLLSTVFAARHAWVGFVNRSVSGQHA